MTLKTIARSEWKVTRLLSNPRGINCDDRHPHGRRTRPAVWGAYPPEPLLSVHSGCARKFLTPRDGARLLVTHSGSPNIVSAAGDPSPEPFDNQIRSSSS